MKYIDAEKLIAEIEKLKERAEAERVLYPKTILSAKNYLLIRDYNSLLRFIASLQREQPEADLEKEIDKEWAKCKPADEGMGLESANIVNEQFDAIASHFYELGLNARKEKKR